MELKCLSILSLTIILCARGQQTLQHGICKRLGSKLMELSVYARSFGEGYGMYYGVAGGG